MKFSPSNFFAKNGLSQLVRLAVPAVFSLAMTAHGATIYWDGSGGASWATVASWSTVEGGGTNPAAVPGTADVANFSSSNINTAQTVNLDAPRSVLGLTFLGTNTATTTLQGGGVANQTLTLAGTGITVNSGAGAVTIGSGTNLQQVAVTLGAAQTWTNNSANTLTVANGVTNGGRLLTLAGSGNTTLGGIVSGTGGLTASGAGIATLSGVNTYTGVTTINAGTLSVDTIGNGGVAGNLGQATSAAANLVLGGGTLRYTGATASTNRAFTLTAATTSSIEVSTAGNTLTMSGASTATTGALTKTGAGTLTLTGANLHTGATVIDRGTVILSGTGAIASSSSVTINSGGTFRLVSTAAENRVSNTAGITMNGGTFDFNHLATNNVNYTETVGALSINSAASTVNTSSANTGGSESSILTFASLARTVGATVNFTGALSSVGDDTNNLRFATGPTLVSGIIGGYATVGGSGWATYITGNLTTTFTTVQALATYVTTATNLNIAANYANDNVDVTTTQTPVGAIAPNSLRFNNATARTLTLTGTNTLVSGGILVTATAAAGGTITGGTLRGASDTDLVVHQYSAGTFSINSIIADNTSATGLTKSGTGALTLGGTNSYTGTTSVNAGTLILSGGAAIANTGAVTLANAAGAVLQLNTSETIGSLSGGGSIGGNVTLGANTLTVGDAGNTSFSGVISGTNGALTKQGAGRLTLSAANTYTGLTTVSAGTLDLGVADAIGGGAVTVNGGILNIGEFADTVGAVTLTSGSITGTTGVLTGTSYALNGAVDTSIGAILAGAGALTKTGAGIATLSGVNTHTGITTINAGTLSVATIGNGGVAGNLGAAAVAATNLVLGGGSLQYTGATASTNRAFTLTNATTSSIEVSSSGTTLTMSGASAATTGGLTKTGTGTLALTGANAFAGDVRVANGTVSINTLAGLGSAQSLGTGAQGQVYLGLDGGTGGTLLYTGAAGTLNHDINVLGVGSAVRNGGTGLLSIQGTITKSSGTLLFDGGTSGITVGSEILGTPGGITTAGLVSLSGAFLSPEETLTVDGTLSLGSTDGGVDQTVAGLTGTGTITGAGATESTLTIALTTGTDTFEGNLGGSTAAEKNLGLSKTGNGTLVLSGNSANTHTGLTTVGGGTLRLNKTSAQALGGDVRIDSGTMEIAASEQISNSSNVSIMGGTITFSGSGRTETVGTFTNSGGTFTTGANTLIGSGNSIYFSGGTNTINSGGLTQDVHYDISGGTNTVEAGGTLEVTSGGIGLDFTGSASPSLVLQSSNSTAGKLLLSGDVTSSVTAGTALISSSGSATNAGTVDLNGGNRTFTVGDGSAATDLQISAAITNGSLTKAGPGNLALAGTNTYSGGTALTAGSVSITAAGNLGTGTVTFSNSARLIFAADGINLTQSIANSSASQYQVAADNTATLSGQISGFGQLQKFGAGTLVLDAANSYSGKTVINGGTLKLGTSGSISATNFDVLGGTFDLNGKSQSVTDTLVLGSASSSGIVSGGGILNVGSSFSLVQGSISSTMAGTGIVSKTGSTTVTLAGSNTYTGATNVTAGKLILNGSTSASSAVGVSSGATLAGSGTVGGDATIASGGALAPGNSPGVLTVAGTSNFASGSMFEWEVDTAQSNPTTNRGVAYDGLNTGAVSGSGAIFKILLTGTQDFSDSFWNQDRTWTDIFKSADGSTSLSNWASVFSGGFQYSYNGQAVAPTSQGFFTTTGGSLTWSAVPEPSNVLAGMLAASVLLRRRRAGLSVQVCAALQSCGRHEVT